MRIRRCTLLYIEPIETVRFELDGLLQGGSGLARSQEVRALAPHLSAPCAVTPPEAAALLSIRPGEWVARESAHDSVAPALLDALIAKGLVITDADDHREWRRRDERIRDTYWYGPSAVTHYLGRWEKIDTEQNEDFSEVAPRLGPPPPAIRERCAPDLRVRLDTGGVPGIGEVHQARVTCRNFDESRPLARDALAQVLHTVFAAQAVVDLGPDQVMLKKNVPSGGGLHPIEAYLLVRNVDGVAPGVYHYHCIDHALEPVQPAEGPAPSALELVAGQRYFADAPVLIALVARFARSFWKYRQHSKAYRVVVLEAGHISQSLYLCATRLGLGAFVTAAINEVETEQAFGLDPYEESPLAICGIGHRAPVCNTTEFDPNGVVWESGA